MALCDVCAGTTAEETVSDLAFRKAVSGGYDPFRMGAYGPTLEQTAAMARISGSDPYEMWRTGIDRRSQAEWMVCDGCLPALRPFLDTGKRTLPRPGGYQACSECGGTNPASQWHCSHCGRVQWGLIGFSLVVGAGLLLWALAIANWLGRGFALAFAVLFLWIGVTSIRDARRNRPSR